MSFWFIFKILFNFSKNLSCLISLLSVTKWHIISSDTSLHSHHHLSDFNIRNTLGLAKYKVSLANIAFFSCVAALLFYSYAQFGTCTWGNILPSQIPFSWSVPRYLEFQLDFPQTEIQYCFKERPVCQCV